MFNAGFGGGSGDFEGLARQYWSAWGEAMRQAGVQAGVIPPPPPSQWQQAVDWWSQLLPNGPSQANEAVARFNRQASEWYGQMQQVAAQFAGQHSNPADISKAWREAIGANALGAAGDNPFLEMFKRMRGPGAHGLDEWLEQVQPYLQGFQQQGQRWLHLPAFGQYREHQERWQALQLAQQEYQQRNADYQQLMAKCMQQAFEVFEAKLAAHEEPGRQIANARALFDLWIDAAEEAYAQTALSQEFRHVTGALTNAQMRLRAAVQLEVEHLTGLFGMPSRTEVDSAHRKIAELERALRRAGAATSARSRPAPAPRTAVREPVQAEAVTAAPRPRAQEEAARPAASKSATPPSKARKSGARKAPPRQTPARQAPARKKTVRKAVAGKKPARQPVAAKAAPRRVAGSRLTAKSAVAKTAPVAAKPLPAQSPATKPKQSASRQAAPKPSLPKQSKSSKPPKQAPAKAAAGSSGSNRVVSMKDWVARYAAANTPAAPDAPKQKEKGGKKGARK